MWHEVNSLCKFISPDEETEYYEHPIANKDWELQRIECEQTHKSTAPLGRNQFQDLYAGGHSQRGTVLKPLNISAEFHYLEWKDTYQKREHYLP